MQPCGADSAGHAQPASPETPPALSPDVELVTYRIAQESLTNPLRHSDARTVTVSLVADAETLTLRVVDNGKGDGWGTCPPARLG